MRRLKKETRRVGDAATRRREEKLLAASPRRRVAASLLLTFAFLLFPFAFLCANAQSERNGSHTIAPREGFTMAERALVERAMGAVCSERLNDPFGSVPIDEMQARPSLPLGHPDAVAGARRAERLLPVARELVIEALRQLSREYRIDPLKVRSAAQRVQAVTRVRPDMDARDNASVYLREPHTINFGTIFLAGLRSDEGMISVIAHELTHIADGRDDALHPLFRVIGARAAARTNLRIAGQRSEELTCDLVGALVAREFVERKPSSEKLARRLARAIEHNCVDEDEADEEHLSPRNTMRALLALDAALVRDLVGSEESAKSSKKLPKQQRPLSFSLTRRSEPYRLR